MEIFYFNQYFNQFWNAIISLTLLLGIVFLLQIFVFEEKLWIDRVKFYFLAF